MVIMWILARDISDIFFSYIAFCGPEIRTHHETPRCTRMVGQNAPFPVIANTKFGNAEGSFFAILNQI